MYSKLICILLFGLLIFNCGGEEVNYTVEEIEGLRIVHNTAPKWGDDPEIGFEFIRSIGGGDETDENYQFFNTREAVLDSEGQLYICDSGNNRIQKFGADGQYITTIGREGQGPGELLSPTGMIIDNENNLHVLNTRNLRIEKFTLDGQYLSSYPMGKFFIYFRMLSDGRLVAPIMNMQGIPGLPGSEDDKTLVSILDNDGNIVSSFGPVKEYDNPMLTGMANIVSISNDSEDNIYVAYTAENKIEKYNSNGDLLLRFDRPLPFEVTVGMGEREIDIGGQIRAFPFPEITFISGASAVDSDNRLWIATYHEQPVLPTEITQMQSASYPESIHIEIYDIEGVWLGNIDPPREDLNFVRIQGTSAFFHDKELMTIHEYRIVGK
ncbi:MAG: 6-bladed beta-propeller [bacterium]|nr:6-bladed beta-propeller [bacterium]